MITSLEGGGGDLVLATFWCTGRRSREVFKGNLSGDDGGD